MHNDTTTVTFSGSYRNQSPAAQADRPPRITFGYNKDHRPDLNQMVLAVVLDGDGRPLCTEMLPGNTADVTVLLPVVDRLRHGFARSCRGRRRCTPGRSKSAGSNTSWGRGNAAVP